MKPTLVILAAGMGSRYGGLKQIDAIGASGEAIIEYSIYDAIRAGFGKVVFVIRKSIEEPFKAKFAGKFEDKIEVEYVFQELDSPVAGLTEFPPREKPWGTGHAVLVAKDAVNEPFAVINADDYYGVEAYQQMADFLTKDCAADHYSMIGYTLRQTLSDHGHVNRGICTTDENSYLQSVFEATKIQRGADGRVFFINDAGEQESLDETALVSMNFWGFHPSYFDALEQDFRAFVAQNADKPRAELYIPTVVNRQLGANEVKLSVIPNDERWYGVTYQEDKPVVVKAFNKMVDDEIYPNPLW
ncbi:MAG: sugar phosphate nucleotidyltransferase [Bacteroidota bacterium]